MRAAFLRAARKLRLADRTTVGLLPAGRTVAIPPVAVQLAFALADLGATPIELVDANTRWPGFTSLVPPTAVPNEFSKIPLSPEVSVASMPPGKRPTHLGTISQYIVKQAPTCAHLLVDLTGFDLIGEQLASHDFVDGVLIIARARTTKEGDLLTAQRDLDPKRNLGVLLVG